MGQTQYYIRPEANGGSKKPLRQGETAIPITEAQAAKGVEFCGLLYEAGRLA